MYSGASPHTPGTSGACAPYQRACTSGRETARKTCLRAGQEAKDTLKNIMAHRVGRYALRYSVGRHAAHAAPRRCTAGAGGEAVSAAGRMFEPARPTKMAAGEFGGKRMGLPPALKDLPAGRPRSKRHTEKYNGAPGCPMRPAAIHNIEGCLLIISQPQRRWRPFISVQCGMNILKPLAGTDSIGGDNTLYLLQGHVKPALIIG